jgi:hypothetical protein
MDLSGFIAELHQELDRINEVIRSLERLSILEPPRRGRPPKRSTDHYTPQRQRDRPSSDDHLSL